MSEAAQPRTCPDCDYMRAHTDRPGCVGHYYLNGSRKPHMTGVEVRDVAEVEISDVNGDAR